MIASRGAGRAKRGLRGLRPLVADNPSVTAAPCHLPLHKGGLFDPNKIASLGRKSMFFCFDSPDMFANRMAYFARKLSRLATYGVRVCDKVRFDFKMSQTPSVPQEGGFSIALLLTKNQCRIGVFNCMPFHLRLTANSGSLV